MSIHVAWDDDNHTLIRWDFETDWHWDDFRAAFEKSVEMGGSVGYRVDVIPFAAATVKLPLGALGEFNRLHRQLPDNVGLIVIAGGSPFTNMIISTFASLNRITTWRTAPTLQDARALILADRIVSPKQK